MIIGFLQKILKIRALFGLLLRQKAKIIILAFALASCAEGQLRSKRINSSDIDFSGVEVSNFFAAFLASCNGWEGVPNNHHISSKFFNFRISDIRDACIEALALSDSKDIEELSEFMKDNFVAYMVGNNYSSDSFFTGYYVPEILGSFVQSEEYPYPVYGFSKLSDKFSRKEIANGSLAGRGLEIAYVADDVDLFFAQIQGSTMLKLDNGERRLLSYAGKNGYPYYSIGKYFRDNNLMQEITAEGLKKWLKEHSEQKQDIMNLNSSYVFFRLKEDYEVVGAANVPLTEMQSLAVDKDYIPYGLPILIDVDLEQKHQEYLTNIKTIMVAQDTGSAIKLANRFDIFFGYGKTAEILASQMQNYGKAIIFLPK